MGGFSIWLGSHHQPITKQSSVYNVCWSPRLMQYQFNVSNLLEAWLVQNHSQPHQFKKLSSWIEYICVSKVSVSKSRCSLTGATVTNVFMVAEKGASWDSYRSQIQINGVVWFVVIITLRDCNLWRVYCNGAPAADHYIGHPYFRGIFIHHATAIWLDHG